MAICNMSRVLAILALLLPSSALADGCADLWFTRNLIMDRAGYCFGSALGQAVFDNGDCIGKTVPLPAGAADRIAEIRAREVGNTTAASTPARRGSTSRMRTSGRIRVHVTAGPRCPESACIGWRQGITALRAAPRARQPGRSGPRQPDRHALVLCSISPWSPRAITTRCRIGQPKSAAQHGVRTPRTARRHRTRTPDKPRLACRIRAGRLSMFSPWRSMMKALSGNLRLDPEHAPLPWAWGSRHRCIGRSAAAGSNRGPAGAVSETNRAEGPWSNARAGSHSCCSAPSAEHGQVLVIVKDMVRTLAHRSARWAGC